MNVIYILSGVKAVKQEVVLFYGDRGECLHLHVVLSLSLLSLLSDILEQHTTDVLLLSRIL